MAYLDSSNLLFSGSEEQLLPQAGVFSDVSQLPGMLTMEEQNIKNMYLQIGKTYLANHRGDPAAEYRDMIASIVHSEDNIVAIWKQIKLAKGVHICECGAEIQKDQLCCSVCGKLSSGYVRCSCGAIVNSNLHFCTNCGNSVAASHPQGIPARRPCPTCGRNLPLDAEFCPGCGSGITAAALKEAPQKHCSRCGTAAAPNQLFCTLCGEPMQESDSRRKPARKTARNARTCSGCGATVNRHLQFCTECGTRL